ncbi:hypothetical protein F4777DRAFT_540902 [Nemania sp. FL0916]|nr:hypothetical protein F4777DRAFT_540902 [Nemania sp. FL0916]
MASANDPALDPALDNNKQDAPAQCSPSPYPGVFRTPTTPGYSMDPMNSVGEAGTMDLGQLVHQLHLNRNYPEPLRRYLGSDEMQDEGFEETERGQELQYEEPDALSVHQPEQWEPSWQTTGHPPALDPILGPIPEFSMQYNPHSWSMQPFYEPPRSPGPSQFPSRIPDAPLEDNSASKSIYARRPRRGTETRLHKCASNPRMLDRMTDMIENSVQCKVQTSTPPSPTKGSSTSSAHPLPMQYMETEDTTEAHLAACSLQLEVDMGFTGPDDDALFGEGLSLRDANTPAGIRKVGFLRYRSSSEAAQACKNMKRSVPRMRRRRKPDKPDPTSAAESSTSKPPSTVS